MRIHSSWRFTRHASLLTAGGPLWLGAWLLSGPASGPEASPAVTMADAPHAEQAANGYGHSIDGNYPAVFAEEDEAGEMLPKNATLLRALVVVLFGLALGWLVASGRMRRRPEVCSPIGCRFR